MPDVKERSDFSIGERASLRRAIRAEDIDAFAELSGDQNPVHVDEDYARETYFGGRIAHGIFVAGLISDVLGNQLPGPGAVYLSQELRFTAPVYPGDELTANVEVLAWDGERGRIKLLTEVVNQDGVQVIGGEAKLVMSAFLRRD